MSRFDKDSLGNRMKGYEDITRNYLMRRQPVIIRLDGKSFHTFTKGFKKPFDKMLTKTMQDTMKYLCENIQGCVLGYTQSDEITLVLVDYKEINSCAWFDNNINKIVSTSASMATMQFNKTFTENVYKYMTCEINWNYFKVLNSAVEKGAMFDSRVFGIPKEEVCNCLIWRQQDATRNSIQSLGQSIFTHKELQGKSCGDIQDMLVLQRGINWNDIPTHLKRGSCCIKEEYKINENTEKESIRTRWIIDKEIPVFTQDRDYVDKLVMF